MNLTERIKLIIKESGLKDYQFASKIGVTRQAVSNYVRGKNEPNNEVIAKIAMTFDVNATWLLTGEGEMFLSSPISSSKEISPREKDLEEKLISALTENELLRATVDSLKAKLIWSYERQLGVNNGVEMEAKRGNIPSVSLSVENGSKSLIIRHKEGQKDDDPLMMNKHTTYFYSSLSGYKKKKEINAYYPYQIIKRFKRSRQEYFSMPFGFVRHYAKSLIITLAEINKHCSLFFRIYQ